MFFATWINIYMTWRHLSDNGDKNGSKEKEEEII